MPALESSTLSVVSDLLHADERPTYDLLKKTIIERCSETEEQKIDKILRGLELGNKQPSQLLRDIKSIAGKIFSEKVIRRVWIQRLPISIQAILQVSSEDDTKLAEMADKIATLVQPTVMQCSTESTGTTQPQYVSDDKYLDLQHQVAALTKRLDKMDPRTHRGRSSVSQRSRSHIRGQSYSPEKEDTYCWYHKTFGNRAKQCRSPCRYNASKN